MSEGQKLNIAICLYCPAENRIVFLLNDSEQQPVYNTLQDFIFDSRSKPAILYFPWYNKCINLKRDNQGFQWYQIPYWKSDNKGDMIGTPVPIVPPKITIGLSAAMTFKIVN